jgi:hypothetical protein
VVSDGPAAALARGPVIRGACRHEATRESPGEGYIVEQRDHAERRARGSLEERESRAHRVLNAFRERRRRRRADDTYFGSAHCLVERAETGSGDPERARRLSELVEEAEGDGMPLDLVERLYEVAREEGLDPGLAYELVRCGLGVIPPPEGVSNAAEQPAADRYLPEWMFPPTPTDSLLRERMLRVSFRRLRALLEEHPEPEDAFRAFAQEPDVDVYGY